MYYRHIQKGTDSRSSSFHPQVNSLGDCPGILLLLTTPGYYFFLVSREIHGNAKNMYVVGTFIAWYHVACDVAMLVRLIESSKPAAHAQAVRLIVPL